MCTWFDRFQISPFGAEHLESIDETSLHLSDLIANENAAGIPNKRIVIGEMLCYLLNINSIMVLYITQMCISFK